MGRCLGGYTGCLCFQHFLFHKLYLKIIITIFSNGLFPQGLCKQESEVGYRSHLFYAVGPIHQLPRQLFLYTTTNGN